MKKTARKTPAEPTIDAQRFKRQLYAMALMIGNKKRMRVGEFFGWIIELNRIK